MTRIGGPGRFGAVVYAKALHPMVAFYAGVANLSEVGADDDFVVLTGDGFELTIVAMPHDVAESITFADPPVRRESTPIKLSFVTTDLDAARTTAASLSGRLDPATSAWTFAGHIHCDGVDPEGNVFQLRQPV